MPTGYEPTRRGSTGNFDDALRPSEVSRIIGVSPTQLREYRIRFDGPPFWRTPGGQARYRRGDVERWIEERTVETTGR